MIQYFVPIKRYSSNSTVPRKGSPVTSPNLTTTGLLNTVTVLEIGSSDILHVAGMLLADQGATVIRIEYSDVPDSSPAYHSVTDRSKQVFTLSGNDPEATTTLHTLLTGASIIIDDLDSKLASTLGVTPNLLAAKNRCILQPSLRPDRPEYWNDTTVAAMAGIYEDGLSIGAPPRYNGVEITATIGALYTVNAAAELLLGSQRFGTVDTIRIPLDRILLFAQQLTIIIRSKPPVSWEPFRMIASPFMGTWKAAGESFIYLHVGMPRHLRSFLFFLDKIGYGAEKAAIRKALHPDTRRDPMTLNNVREGKVITGIFQKLFLQKPADEWEELLGNAGFCCTKIRSFDEWCRHPQVTLTHQILGSTNSDGSPLPLPGALFSSLRHPDATVAPPPAERNYSATGKNRDSVPDVPPSIGQNTSLPLQGIRVLDLGRVIAGPYCGRLLAEAGAEVLHVSLRNNHLNWEEPFGIIYNTGKTSVTLDFNNPEGKEAFRKLFAWFNPDVVVHNFMDDAARKIGCDYAGCKALKDDVIVVDFAGYSRGGPWENFPGFEQNVQAASGILATFSSGSAPRILPVPVNDLSAGLIGAFGVLLSLLHRTTSGEGNRITSYINFPSILVHLHSLSRRIKEERAATINRYFKASDGYFLLSASRSSLDKFFTVPEIAALTGNPTTINENDLEGVFKKRRVSWWSHQVEAFGLKNELHIVPRRSLSQLLKKELSADDSLFTSAYHEGLGQVVYSQPPLFSEKSQLRTISPAPYPGSGTTVTLEKIGIDPKRHTPAIPHVADKPVSLPARIWWIIRQLKWLSVVAYRNRFLKGF